MKVVCFVLIDFLIIGVPILEYILGNHLLRKRDDAEEKDAWMLTVFGWGLRAWVVINVFIKAIVLVWAIVVVLLSAESMRAAGNAMGNLSIPQQIIGETGNVEDSSVGTPTTENLDIYIVQYAKTDALSKANEGFKQALQDSNVSCNFTEQNASGNSQLYKAAIDKAVSNKETKAVLIGKWHADFTNATDAYEVIIPENTSDDEDYQIGYEAGLSFVVGAN